MVCLELVRRQIAQGRVPPDCIIKPSDVIENISASLRSSFVVLVMNLLTFQGAEKLSITALS